MHWFSILLVPAIAAAAVPSEPQQILKRPDSFKDLINKLKLAEIIPTVIPHSFEPKLTLGVDWKHESADLGNTITPKKAQKAPRLDLLARDTATFAHLNATQLTVVLSDPDAPSRDDPRWSQFCHWIATDVRMSGSVDAGGRGGGDYDEVVEYQPPGPPKKTGKHRYVFVALAPVNGTAEKLHLSVPGGRRRWGYEGVRAGLERWMGENGLEVVGANFVYAQHKKQ